MSRYPSCSHTLTSPPQIYGCLRASKEAAVARTLPAVKPLAPGALTPHAVSLDQVSACKTLAAISATGRGSGRSMGGA